MALDHKLVDPDTIIKNIPRDIKCSIHKITDMKEHPKNLTVEEILVRSSNVGSVILAKKIGEERFKDFVKNRTYQKSGYRTGRGWQSSSIKMG